MLCFCLSAPSPINIQAPHEKPKFEIETSMSSSFVFFFQKYSARFGGLHLSVYLLLDSILGPCLWIRRVYRLMSLSVLFCCWEINTRYSPNYLLLKWSTSISRCCFFYESIAATYDQNQKNCKASMWRILCLKRHRNNACLFVSPENIAHKESIEYNAEWPPLCCWKKHVFKLFSTFCYGSLEAITERYYRASMCHLYWPFSLSPHLSRIRIRSMGPAGLPPFAPWSRIWKLDIYFCSLSATGEFIPHVDKIAIFAI